MDPIIQKRAKSPDEWPFFAVMTNRDLLQYITNYYAKNIGDFIISGRKCPFGPNFGLTSTYLRTEIRRAARANSIIYFNWLLDRFLASFDTCQWHILGFGTCGIRYSKNVEFCLNILEKCFLGITKMESYIYLVFKNIIMKFIYDENIPVLEKLGKDHRSYIWSQARRFGSEFLIEELYKNGFECDVHEIYAGINFMNWHSKKYPNCPENCDLKVDMFRPDLTPKQHKYWHDNQHSTCDKSTNMLVTIKKGDLEILQYLYENCNKVIEPRAFKIAARNGHVHILKWLNSKVSTGPIYAIEEAIKSGSYPTIEYILATGDVVRPRFMSVAAHSGNLKLLKYLEKYCPKYNIECAHSLIHSGHLNVLCHLYKTGRVKITHQHLKKAAKSGYLKIVKWIVKTGITPYRQIMDIARDNSHTRICLWLHKKYKFELTVRDVTIAWNKADVKLLDRVMKVSPELIKKAFDVSELGVTPRECYIRLVRKHWESPKIIKQLLNSLRKHKLYICEIDMKLEYIYYNALWLLLPEM